MLNNHHRAVYRFHHRYMETTVGQRRVYYVVTESAKNTFDVMVLKCSQKAKVSPLPYSEQANVLCFTAKGNEIETLPDKRGRYSSRSPFHVTTIKL